MEGYRAGDGPGLGGTRYGAWDEDDVSRQPTGELVKELFGEAQHLIRGEVALAKAELREEAKKLAKGGGEIAAGGVIAHTAFLAFAAGLILLLGTFMPWWLAAVIVAVAFGIAAAVLAKEGIEKTKKVHGPERTIQSLKEDRRWAREAIRNAKSDTHGNA